MSKDATKPVGSPGRFPVPDAEDTNVARPPVADELPLPHERDEAPDPDAPESRGPREEIEQAGRDIERGLKDSERRGVPSDVPGPGTPPGASRGADVPADAPAGAAHGPRKGQRWR